MDKLPQELIELILLWDIRMCPCNKNTITPLRLVCKSFDKALRPYVFRTLQLEFSKFLREGSADLRSVDKVGDLCQAVYLDMMVVRDEEEICRLSEVFQGITTKVPEMEHLIQALRKYCMNDTTFDEIDFTRVMKRVFEITPNLTRLRVNLPFQVVGRTSATSTLLLANILACVANRSEEESKLLDVLVVDHLSDTTVTNLCNNHRDVSNAVKTLSGVRHLVLSIKRQEARDTRQAAFTQQLWFLIRRAKVLESLCLIGWNVKRNIALRQHRHSVGFNDWTMRSLPYFSDPTSKLCHLRCLELKRVDVDPHALVDLIRDISTSLKELFLNEVYLKVFGHEQQALTPLWIGRHQTSKPVGSFWVAEELRSMEDLQLSILRVTGLGYDDFERDRNSLYDYDLTDPTGLDLSFDQRFVEAVLLPRDEDASTKSPASAPRNSLENRPTTFSDLANNTSELIPLKEALKSNHPLIDRCFQPRREYDVEAYQQHYNTTSHFKKCIDGYFTNHNEQALLELQRIIAVADHGMALISDEIDRTHAAEITADGDMAIP